MAATRSKRELGLHSTRDAYPGAVTVIQWASSHLALNPHFHSLVTDGVYVRDRGGKLEFHALTAPSRVEVAATCTPAPASARTPTMAASGCALT